MNKTERKIKEINKEIKTLKGELASLTADDSRVLSVDELKKEREIRTKINHLREYRKSLESREGKNFDSKYIIYSSVVLVLLLTLTNLILFSKKLDNESVSKNNTPASYVTPAPISYTSLTSAPTLTPEVKAMFSDAKSEEELIERANQIYDIDLKPILAELNSEQMNNKVSIENLVDMLSMGLGELPVNTEYDANSIDEMYKFRSEVFGNMGSTPSLTKIYPSHYALLAPDNSELSEYMATYDELYNNIAEARNNGDVESFIKNAEALGKKHYDEYVLTGLYGGFNPDMLDSEVMQLAFAAADERYASYVLEYILDKNLTICVPACYDPITGEYKNLNVVDIEEALVLGTSMNKKVSLSYYGEAQDVNLPREYYYLLANKLDGMTLKRG